MKFYFAHFCLKISTFSSITVSIMDFKRYDNLTYVTEMWSQTTTSWIFYCLHKKKEKNLFANLKKNNLLLINNILVMCKNIAQNL